MLSIFRWYVFLGFGVHSMVFFAYLNPFFISVFGNLSGRGLCVVILREFF